MKKVLSLIFSFLIFFTTNCSIQTFTKADELIDIELIPSNLDSTGDTTKWKFVDQNGNEDAHYESQNTINNSIACKMMVKNINVNSPKSKLNFDWKADSKEGYNVLAYVLRDSQGNLAEKDYICGHIKEYQTKTIKLLNGKYTLEFIFLGDQDDGIACVKNIKLKTMESNPVTKIPRRYFSTKKNFLDNLSTYSKIAIGNRPKDQKYHGYGYAQGIQDVLEAPEGPMCCLVFGSEGKGNEKDPKGLVVLTQEPIIGCNQQATFENGKRTDGMPSSRFYMNGDNHTWKIEQNGNGSTVEANHWGASDLRKNLNTIVINKIFRETEKSLILKSKITTKAQEYSEYTTEDYLYVPRCEGYELVLDENESITIGENENFKVYSDKWPGTSWLRSPNPDYGSFALSAMPGIGGHDNTTVDDPAVIACFKLNLTNVKFASAAISEPSSTDSNRNFTKIAASAPMYLRLSGDTDLENTNVSIEPNSFEISVKNAPKDSRLMVQLVKQDGGVYQYSQNISDGSLDIDLNTIEGLLSIGESSADVKGFAWVESGNPKETTVFHATEAKPLNFKYFRNIEVEGVYGSLTIAKNTSQLLIAKAFPKDINLIWNSSDPNIATIEPLLGDDTQAILAAKNFGTTVITVSSANLLEGPVTSFEIKVKNSCKIKNKSDGGYPTESWLWDIAEPNENNFKTNRKGKISFAWYDGKTQIDGIPNKVGNYTLVTTLEESDKYVCAKCDIPVRIKNLDIQGITCGKILINENPLWQRITSPVSFDLFSKNPQAAKISVQNLECAKKIHYLLTNESQIPDYILSGSEPPSDREILKILEVKDWQDYINDITLSKDGKYIIYARIEDNIGNLTYLVSKGVVVYSDSTIKKGFNHIEYEKHSAEDKTIKLKSNGNGIRDITNDERPLIKNKDYTKTEKNGIITIKLKSEYLESLKKGTYNIKINCKPQGIKYSTSSKGDSPNSLDISLNVKKTKKSSSRKNSQLEDSSELAVNTDSNLCKEFIQSEIINTTTRLSRKNKHSAMTKSSPSVVSEINFLAMTNSSSSRETTHSEIINSTSKLSKKNKHSPVARSSPNVVNEIMYTETLNSSKEGNKLKKKPSLITIKKLRQSKIIKMPPNEIRESWQSILNPTESERRKNCHPNTETSPLVKERRESIIITAPIASNSIESLADVLIDKIHLNEYMEDVLRSVFRGIYWLGVNPSNVNLNTLSAHISDLPPVFFEEPVENGMTLLDKALIAWDGSDKISTGGIKARQCATYIIDKNICPSEDFFKRNGDSLVENYIMFGSNVDEWKLIAKLAEMGLNLNVPLVRKHISVNNSPFLNDYYNSHYTKDINCINSLRIPNGVMSKEPFLNIIKYCQKNGWNL